MKTITAYETKDGKIFKDKEAAEDHEYILSLPSDKALGLSKRENEIYNLLISTDLQNVEIAKNLDISESCIKKHCKSIYEKCGVQDRISLIMNTRKLERGIA